LKLLLIDDDDDDVLFFSDALRSKYPHVVIERFRSGIEALTSMRNEGIANVDIIFLDVNLPALNGWECLREIKAVAGWQKVPIVMYSTANLFNTGVQPADVGAAAFYTKSDSFEDLIDSIGQALQMVFAKGG